MQETVVVLDFGGQYKELIARRVRENGVYSIIKPGSISLEELQALNPIGLILTGGPNSVYEEDSPKCDPELFSLGIPVLGICYGMQLLTWTLGGEVSPCEHSEYGKTPMELLTKSLMTTGLDSEQVVLMSHTDQVSRLPEGFETLGRTESCPHAFIQNEESKIYGMQFHPEVESSEHGIEMMRNFLYEVCGAKGEYSLANYEEEMIRQIREQVGDEHVILALSGGVDSSVCAALLTKAIPGQLHCIFVDHGLMRLNEADEVEAAFQDEALDFIRVNAEERFLAKLKGVIDPEKKRKVIGEEFVRVFEEESQKLKEKFGAIRFLAQGTIYPDVIESGANNSATIKSHHNVGGLPEDMSFTDLVEPLRALFKDEVRKIGMQMGLESSYVERQPFPGPGLAVRVIGEITKEKCDTLRKADAIFREEMAKSGAHADQFFAVLTDTRSVGVMGDFRTYGLTVALRAVLTNDFMTCEYAPLDHELLGRTAKRIVNSIKDVSRVVYDITSKPPGTIEWE